MSNVRRRRRRLIARARLNSSDDRLKLPPDLGALNEVSEQERCGQNNDSQKNKKRNSAQGTEWWIDVPQHFSNTVHAAPVAVPTSLFELAPSSVPMPCRRQ
ncbi:hypothetical protein Y600_6004 [Burkholderia pseudomallei MSHR3709]|nr:hypothetical protein Y600_6004 [Burkholderia pseudomallei MSHR3709]